MYFKGERTWKTNNFISMNNISPEANKFVIVGILLQFCVSAIKTNFFLSFGWLKCYLYMFYLCFLFYLRYSKNWSLNHYQMSDIVLAHCLCQQRFWEILSILSILFILSAIFMSRTLSLTLFGFESWKHFQFFFFLKIPFFIQTFFLLERKTVLST